MSIIVECGKSNTGPKNTGAKEQCYLGVTTKYAFSPDPEFGFAKLEDLKTKEKWDEAIAQKKIYPLYEVEEYTNADTEDGFYDGFRRQIKTSSGNKIRTFRTIIGLCSYAALKSHSGKSGRVFEFTEDPGIKAVQSNDLFKGQKATLEVGKLQDSVAGTPQSTVVSVNYTDEKEYTYNGVNVRLDGWGDQDVFGIFDVNFQIVSASSTSIKFKVGTGCSGGDDFITSLGTDDIILRDTNGAIADTSFVAADGDGVYELTGTAFASNFTLATNGVVTVAGMSYESPEPLKITIE